MAATTAQPNQQALVKSPGSQLQGLLEAYKGQIAMALPKHMTPERMIRVAITAYTTTPALQSCDIRTVAGCIVQSSILGLEPNSVLGESYLIPYGKVCQLIPGYKGLLKLARNSGQLAMVNAQPVHQNDTFEFEDGLDARLIHKRPDAWAERGAVVGYWAGAVLKDGSKQFVVMSRVEAEQHGKRFSKTFAKGPWTTDFDAMALKTCIRKLCKLLPQSVEMQAAVSLDERNEAGLAQQFTIDVPPELQPPSDDPAADAGIQMPQRASESSSQTEAGKPAEPATKTDGEQPPAQEASAAPAGDRMPDEDQIQAHEALEAKLGRRPTMDELREELERRKKGGRRK